MKTLRILFAAALLPLVAVGQVINLTQPSGGTYVDNEIPRRNGTGASMQASAVVIEDAASNNITIGASSSSNDLTLRGGTAGATVSASRAANGDNTFTPSGSGLNVSNGPFRMIGTNTLRFGATANATIGASADTTAGLLTFTGASSGAFTFDKPVLVNGLTTIGTGALQFAVHTTNAGGITLGATQNIWTSAPSIIDFGFSGTSKLSLSSTGALMLTDGGSNAHFDVVDGAAIVSTNALTRSVGTSTNHTFLIKSNAVTAMSISNATQDVTFTANILHAAATAFTIQTTAAQNLIWGYNSSAAVTISSAGATGMRFNGYGAGALTTDASGNITAASDARMKEQIRSFTRGLADLSGLRPAIFRWKKSSGLDTAHDYAGFVAQNVQATIPEAVGESPDGMLTLSDRPILAATVNAVNELERRTHSIPWAFALAACALVVALAGYFKR